MSELPFHALSRIFPLLDGPAFDEFLEDIRDNGQVWPILVHKGQIIDGRNRYRACQRLDIEPFVENWEGDESRLLEVIVSLNLHRRHLDESQRALVGARIRHCFEAAAAQRQRAGLKHNQAAIAPESFIPTRPEAEYMLESPAVSESQPISTVPAEMQERAAVTGEAAEQAAAVVNVSPRSIYNASKVLAHGAPELVAAVDAGKVAVSAAAEIATLPLPRQAEIVARTEDEIRREAKKIAERRAAENAARRAELATRKVAELPRGQYACLVVDPPWPMEKIERDVRPNQVGFDYPTMNEAEMAALPIGSLAGPDAHLFLWTTHRFLPMALRLADVWGFRYICTMVWRKPGGFQPVGLPQFNCEFVLLCKRGNLPFITTTSFPCCFDAPRREHSRKPDEFYQLIARVSPGPRIDVFSREARDGFDQWGNETRKFDAQRAEVPDELFA